MRNIKIIIQYDGSRYSGWQKQANTENTIQYKLEMILSLMTCEDIDIIAAGRTDAGVHADNQVANFKTHSNMSIINILKYCYKYLPEDIVIKSAVDVDLSFHSRFKATGKKYIYHIYNNKKYRDVFSRKHSYYIKNELDIDKIREISKMFIGTHDFRNLAKKVSKNKSAVRTIYDINILKQGSNIQFIFEGDSFLYKMVRMISAVLIMAGQGAISQTDLNDLLNNSKIDKKITPAYPHGLFLKEVYYQKK